jgi:hypothetical protein
VELRLSRRWTLWQTAAVKFVVSFEGQRRVANLVFGTPMDMPGLLRWRSSVSERSDPQVRDAMEFRKLATKRWRGEHWLAPRRAA